MNRSSIQFQEEVVSKRTEILFALLAVLFFSLFIWRVTTGGSDLLAGVILFFFCLFVFYSINFRTLIIRLTAESLTLTFGIFTWTIPLDNIIDCKLDDDLPALMKYGGAGIHFMFIRRRYRASFNFLEHPRVVIQLMKKVGPVRDISFSTRQPNDVLRLLQEAVSAKRAARY
jgi:hypothetical protein